MPAVRMAAALLLVGCASASTEQPRPMRLQEPAAQGRTVTAWLDTRSLTDTPFSEWREVMARNDSTAPIAVTAVRLSRCVNVRQACDSLPIDPVILAPGESIDVLAVQPARWGQSWRFDYALIHHPATECIAADPVPRSGRTTSGPSARVMIVPPFPTPASIRGKQVDITFFVAASGRVDSVSVPGLPDGPYLRQLRATMSRYAFRPQLRNGCPVPGQSSVTITF
jgi:hypothetical protein